MYNVTVVYFLCASSVWSTGTHLLDKLLPVTFSHVAQIQMCAMQFPSFQLQTKQTIHKRIVMYMEYWFGSNCPIAPRVRNFFMKCQFKKIEWFTLQLWPTYIVQCGATLPFFLVWLCYFLWSIKNSRDALVRKSRQKNKQKQQQQHASFGNNRPRYSILTPLMSVCMPRSYLEKSVCP